MRARRWGLAALRWLVLFAVLFWSAAPIVLVALSSLKVPSRIWEYPPNFVFVPSLINYTNLYQRWPEFFIDLGNSFIITAGATLLTLAVSIPAAYAYSRYSSTGLRLSAFAMLAIRMFPPIVVTLPLYPVIRALNLNDRHLLLVVIYSAFFVSLGTWVMKAFIDEVPRELDEAAVLDGCNVMQLITRIIVPLSRHGIVATSVFVAVFAWKEFLFAFLFTTNAARTAPVIVNEMLGSVTGIQWGPVLAAACLQLLPILIFVLFAQRFLMSGLTMGATKG